jgi:hypothetical protein
VCVPCSCFGQGTLITMADDSNEPIELVKAGDRVLSYDVARSVWEPAMVEESVTHAPQDGTGVFIVVNGTLRLTSNHPVWSGGERKLAEALQPGDPIVMLTRGASPVHAVVQTIERVASREVTYDLHVSGSHAYVAGGIVVAHKIVQQQDRGR